MAEDSEGRERKTAKPAAASGLRVRRGVWIFAAVGLALAVASRWLAPGILRAWSPSAARQSWVEAYASSYSPSSPNGRGARVDPALCRRVIQEARALTARPIRYDPAYYPLAYPGGDPPPDSGVCADVVIRSWRAAGMDLQALVHEDMKANFAQYPSIWRLREPDPNIDHRRVPNLMAYFHRRETALPLSRDGRDYDACDVVAWDLGQGVTHIGIVSDRMASSEGGPRPLIIHHISGAPREEDALLDWRIIGHYRVASRAVADR